MSLKSRLRISIVTLVTLVVLAQCVGFLRIAAEDKFQDTFDRAQQVATQVRTLVLQRANEQARAATPPPASQADFKQFFRNVVIEDRGLPPILEKAAASSSFIMEITVCDDAGVILASSSPGRRVTYQSLPSFEEWKVRPFWDRLVEILTQSREYAIVVPLGVETLPGPILTVRVEVSSLLIRQNILPQVSFLAGVSLLSLLAAILLAYLFSNVVLRSLDRLSRRIESIATGQFAPGPGGRESKEFATIQSKLDILSRQFRGAREDVVQMRNNIDLMLERLEEGVLLFNPSHRLLRASRSVEALLGIPREALAGQALHELFPEATQLGDLLRRAMATQKSVRDVPVTWRRDPAPAAHLLVNVELLEYLPEPGKYSLLVTLRDAETRSELRSQLDISTRLAAISRLTGGVAHEIKNPLNAIALHLEVLKSKLEGDDHVDREVSVIGGEIARLDRVVKTFLDFTRPVELNLRRLNLVEVARQVAALVWPEAERAGVSVEFDSSDSAAFIRGDEDLIKQALLNVVSNGIEAMRSGGRLRIHVDREADDVVIRVSDQGQGIPPEVRDKIFNLYFTTKQKGSGIGLAMTFRIVQLHNATVDFTSETGLGTTFFLRFPGAAPSAAPAEPATSAELAPVAQQGESARQ